ncbi:MAG: hypothetical protein ABL921_07150 [Pirellula sp.]
MPPKRPARLEFTDCRGCGKRIATTATLCRHCNTARLPTHDHFEDESDDDDSNADAHGALGYGGYDEYDVEEEVEKPSRMKAIWWMVAWSLIAFFVLTIFLPFW